ncbi:MAG: hypothetical protein JWQ40_2107 [Segetibacter sp.]|jgi:hypothetical protein|nr:hypothetical protein [Segetibacter sp.]
MAIKLLTLIFLVSFLIILAFFSFSRGLPTGKIKRIQKVLESWINSKVRLMLVEKNKQTTRQLALVLQ